jgi:hypothetical protein
MLRNEASAERRILISQILRYAQNDKVTKKALSHCERALMFYSSLED